MVTGNVIVGVPVYSMYILSIITHTSMSTISSVVVSSLDVLVYHRGFYHCIVSPNRS